MNVPIFKDLGDTLFMEGFTEVVQGVVDVPNKPQ